MPTLPDQASTYNKVLLTIREEDKVVVDVMSTASAKVRLPVVFKTLP